MNTQKINTKAHFIINFVETVTEIGWHQVIIDEVKDQLASIPSDDYSHHKDLTSVFIWSCTAQGHEYWYFINECIKCPSNTIILGVNDLPALKKLRGGYGLETDSLEFTL